MVNRNKLYEKKEELINSLLDLVKLKEQLWNYHPDNPERNDLVSDFDYLTNLEKMYDNELKALDIKIKEQ